MVPKIHLSVAIPKLSKTSDLLHNTILSLNEIVFKRTTELESVNSRIYLFGVVKVEISFIMFVVTLCFVSQVSLPHSHMRVSTQSLLIQK